MMKSLFIKHSRESYDWDFSALPRVTWTVWKIENDGDLNEKNLYIFTKLFFLAANIVLNLLNFFVGQLQYLSG